MLRKALVARLAVTIGVIFALTACGSVSGDDVEKRVSAKVKSTTGLTLPKVDCPGNLPAKKGGKITCTVTAIDTHGIKASIKAIITITHVGFLGIGGADYTIKLTDPDIDLPGL